MNDLLLNMILWRPTLKYVGNQFDVPEIHIEIINANWSFPTKTLLN